jgi:hypothetical protein
MAKLEAWQNSERRTPRKPDPSLHKLKQLKTSSYKINRGNFLKKFHQRVRIEAQKERNECPLQGLRQTVTLTLASNWFCWE